MTAVNVMVENLVVGTIRPRVISYLYALCL